MAKTIFRKIGGKIIPIRIKNVKGAGSSKWLKQREFIATTEEGHFVGRAVVDIPKKGRHATIDHIKVEPKFRRKGIAKNLMKAIANFNNRIDKPFLRTGGTGLQSPAMVNIRKKLGKSKFWADNFGPYGEQTKMVSSMRAKNIIRNESHRIVDTTTLLKKKKWKIK